MIPVVLGLEGLTLTAREVDFIQSCKPAAFLLFARNIESVEQAKALTAHLRRLMPDALIGVDQEGGRVQRLTFHGRYPSAVHYGKWFEFDKAVAVEAARLHGFLLGSDLQEIGADWVYAPVLDRLYPDTNDMIGSRTLGHDVEGIIELASAMIKGIEAAGCHACIKHAPGQGRATLDTHKALPLVEGTLDELADDFLPFKTLAPKVPFMMTSHTAFKAFGEKPATMNPAILNMLKQDWGGGLVVADDLGMEALKGTYVSRFLAAIEAGCDLAICSFSRLREGMAGTVYAMDDAELFFAAAKDFREVTPRVKRGLAALPVLQAVELGQVEESRARFAGLWADAPTELGYTWPQ